MKLTFPVLITQL